jgi:hypothetical protein
MRLRLAAYGLAVALAGCALLAVAGHWKVTSLRAYFLNNATSLQRLGAPPLVAIGTKATPRHPVFVPAGGGDDAGSFVLGPALARLLGLSRGVLGLEALYLLLFGIGLASYPLLFYELFGSLRAALAAPLALLAGLLLVVGTADVYWSGAWAPLVLGPPLVLVAIRRPSRSILWLAGIALAASLATSLRSGAGLGICVGCAIAALTIDRRWSRRLTGLLAVVIAYLAIAPGAIALVEAYRDARLHHPLAVSTPSSHLFWHPLYLGLGSAPNRYGLRWKDQIAIHRAEHVDPNARYPTGAYDAVVRTLFIRLLKHDPSFVADAEGRKVVVAVGRAPVLSILAILALYVFALYDRIWLRALLVLAPAAVLGLAGGVVGMPDAEYLEGWLGTLLVIVFIALGLILSEGLDGLRRIRERVGRWRIASGVAAAACVATLVAALLTPGLSSSCRRWQGPRSATSCGGYEFPLP